LARPADFNSIDHFFNYNLTQALMGNSMTTGRNTYLMSLLPSPCRSGSVIARRSNDRAGGGAGRRLIGAAIIELN
jgi:hypothetical protein